MPSLHTKIKILLILAKNVEKQKLNFSHSALLYMKSRVSLNYFVKNCQSRFAVKSVSCIRSIPVSISNQFPIKSIFLLLNQHQAFLVCLNLLLSSYNNFHNNYFLANNQLCNNLLDQLQFFKYFHMFLNRILPAGQRSFFHQS